MQNRDNFHIGISSNSCSAKEKLADTYIKMKQLLSTQNVRMSWQYYKKDIVGDIVYDPSHISQASPPAPQGFALITAPSYQDIMQHQDQLPHPRINLGQHFSWRI
ncbi:unnamed protein product [Cuscuta europaea]|uniref:Uncharacterized protein n=1 Tax=Cuscuta europaea TaxID=41803 RepID=A0A9P1E8T0_CUSEU|nr:unnamed protein product [Cuscuta europaea]